MTKQEKLLRAKELLELNWSHRKIAKELGVDHGTINYWKKKDFILEKTVQADLNDENVQKAYAYILSLYLGDGHIVKFRRTYRFRISQDGKYPNLVKRHIKEIQIILPTNKVNVGLVKGSNVRVVYTCSNILPDLFPQHGPGKKYTRKIELQPWQLDICKKYPWQFLEGFIHSDGSIYNDRGYEMICFTNRSLDIIQFFMDFCNMLEVKYTLKNPIATDNCYHVFIRTRNGVNKVLANIEHKTFTET